jgi:hypothetical protein
VTKGPDNVRWAPWHPMARTRIRVDAGDCPDSHMDDGSHSASWQDGDWCEWCGDKQEAADVR